MWSLSDGAPGAGRKQGSPTAARGWARDAAPLSHLGEEQTSVSVSARRNLYLKISLSKVKLTFEQQSHPFQGREKQRNPIFTGLLRVDTYAKLQL